MFQKAEKQVEKREKLISSNKEAEKRRKEKFVAQINRKLQMKMKWEVLKQQSKCKTAAAILY